MALGCYTPKYLSASFKGFSFPAIEADSEHGRRGAHGEFPFGEDTAYGDLGRKIRKYSIKAAFRDNSHIDDANALIAVCESPGPGLLVHPTRGTLTAACESIKVRDSIEEQGETIVDLEFIEANDWFGGFHLVEALAGLVLTEIVSAAQDAFMDAYKPREVPFFDVGTVRQVAASGIAVLSEALGRASGLQGDQTFWRVQSELASIAANPSETDEPSHMWTALAGSVAAVDAYAINTDAKVSALRSVSNWAAAQVTPSGYAASSVDAVLASLRILSASYLAKAAAEQRPRTLQEAFTQYDMVAQVLSEEMRVARGACNDSLFLALRTFTGSAQTQLLNRAYNLPAVVQYDMHGPMFSLAAAYDIYGDAKKFATIERYNANALPFAVGNLVTATRAA